MKMFGGGDRLVGDGEDGWWAERVGRVVVRVASIDADRADDRLLASVLAALALLGVVQVWRMGCSG